MMIWRKAEIEGYAAWIGETDLVSIGIIPELGSKMITLRNRKTDREWLWRSGKPLGNGGYGSSFAAGDESGWDEMFPCIDACMYPQQPWQDRAIPDHGEVWSLGWEHHCTGSALHCRVEGVQLPYLLEKVYSCATEGTIRIDYTLTNKSDSPFSFLWAAHPLLQIHEGMQLHMPSELKEIEVAYSEGGRLGVSQDTRSWPFVQTAAGIVDLSTMEPAAGNFAEKYYFTGKLGDGFVGISDPVTGEALWFTFPAEQVPYLAVWANYAGYGGNYHVALEPATGRMDSLQQAIPRNEAAVVEGQGIYRWFLEINIT
ncbi:hypothetical protein [Paenibacillus monticola]|uniref:Galactose mutarotase n=1 Tax=Paenibacillus monticola TaxID=2666075 RepID=A0A7X2HAM2_9BACL|nr:hypothetical protein [Paenibacillus monticola]MRN55893.1 hypothetical protein [Paenibacillus monticola]